jgi:DNA-binding NarL/FixJ family response regulator
LFARSNKPMNIEPVTATAKSAGSKENDPKRIFIVDDHPVFREGLVGFVGRERDLAICGEADNALTALTAIEKAKPDLVLVDIGLPGKSGLELIKDIQAVNPETPVLAISMHDETLYAERVLRAGGRGYLMKQEGPEKMLQAIRHVLSGQIAVSAKMSARILDALSGRRDKNTSPISRLTDREFEILRFIGSGKDSHAIAKHLNLSVKTVDTHRTHLKEKLNLSNGTELICYAARWVETESAAEA